ncbi:hypothetical protein HY524_01990 [Candidatus Berkelbacteria bacterium]|nr:hypothetical protein [Candidatus Berkelbacteria bacterium]
MSERGPSGQDVDQSQTETLSIQETWSVTRRQDQFVATGSLGTVTFSHRMSEQGVSERLEVTGALELEDDQSRSFRLIIVIPDDTSRAVRGPAAYCLLLDDTKSQDATGARIQAIRLAALGMIKQLPSDCLQERAKGRVLLQNPFVGEQDSSS